MLGGLKTLMGSGFSGQQAIANNGYSTLAVTATGATQGTAIAIATEFTEFTTVAAGTGSILPGTTGLNAPGALDVFLVANQGANALLVYPPVGFAIGLAAANAGVSVASGKTALFVAKGNGNYYALLSA